MARHSYIPLGKVSAYRDKVRVGDIYIEIRPQTISGCEAYLALAFVKEDGGVYSTLPINDFLLEQIRRGMHDDGYMKVKGTGLIGDTIDDPVTISYLDDPVTISYLELGDLMKRTFTSLEDPSEYEVLHFIWHLLGPMAGKRNNRDYQLAFDHNNPTIKVTVHTGTIYEIKARRVNE